MKNLKKLWSTEGVLVDKNGDGIIDGASIFIELPQTLMPEGLFDFFARVGLETTAISYNFFEFTDQNIRMTFKEVTDETYATFEQGELICFYQNVSKLSSLLTRLSEIDYKPEEVKKVADQKRSINSLSDIWSFSGFGTFEEASPHHELSLNIKVERTMQNTELFKEMCHFIARAALYSTSLNLPLTDNEQARIQFHIRQEKDEEPKLRLLEKNHFELSGRIGNCHLALRSLNNNKHWSQRGEYGFWEQEMMLNDKKEAELWMEASWEDHSERDLVLEALSDFPQKTLKKLEIYLSEPLQIRKEFEKELSEKFPEAEKIIVRSAYKTAFHWIREELLPVIGPKSTGLHISVRKELHGDGLELPIRWIQELYPIDKLIEKYTHITADDVTFSLHNQQKFTYQVELLSEDGAKEQIGALEVPISQMPYINQNQFAYPSTGAVKMYQDQLLIKEVLIPTDRERFYLYYLQKFLPHLQQNLAGFNEGQGQDRPLFDRIELDITMSEEEEKLYVDEERTSSLEALYEDLYFNTLDYFSNWGLKTVGQSFDAPGGIHPYMHIKPGAKPSASLRVYRWEDRELSQLQTTQLIFDPSGSLRSAIVLKDGQEVTMPIRKPKVQTYFECADSGKPVIAEHSYKGLPIPVLEYYIESKEAFDSAIKLTLFKKTILIEAGHHANEISSTPAVLKLMQNAGDYLKEMNIIVIPNANPDGFQLLQKLVKEHPEWKHHAARYNAVGLEFAHIRYKQTIFGEANVLPLIMKKWAPDIIVDDHGIPAHEWVQPFAGYNSPPRFPVSYFLPSAKIYGIGRISEKVNTKIQADNLEKIVDSISSTIADTSIAKENEYWQKRFIKYGNQWLPEKFPIEEAPYIHFYRQQSVTSEYPTVSILRYPEWVAADIISEAADEVVYGETLDSCIEAHYLFNQGILALLQKSKTNLSVVGLTKFRERPIRFN